MRRKQCAACKKKLPATLKYFHKRKDRKDGLRYSCKVCTNKKNTLWRNSPIGQKLQQKYRESGQQRERNNKYVHTLKGTLGNRYTTIKQRCEDRKDKRYKYYDGRGIKCKFRSRQEFIKYVLEELKIENLIGLEIDRINNDGHYEPGNIRFVTHKVNINNRRNSKCE
jgi:hypothetical protein